VVNAADAALAKAKAQNPANPAAVQAAQDQLDIAKAQRADTLADPDTSQQESALEAAQSDDAASAGIRSWCSARPPPRRSRSTGSTPGRRSSSPARPSP
jgi:hypothetical protein